MNDSVNHPSHYTQGGVEFIVALEAALSPEAFKGFCVGNAMKYLWRHQHKNGLEDVKKSRWYTERLISVLEAEKCRQ